MNAFYALLEVDPKAALADVTFRREHHRRIRHGTTDPDPDLCFDCAACGVLDSQLARAQRKMIAASSQPLT